MTKMTPKKKKKSLVGYYCWTYKNGIMVLPKEPCPESSDFWEKQDKLHDLFIKNFSTIDKIKITIEEL